MGDDVSQIGDRPGSGSREPQGLVPLDGADSAAAQAPQTPSGILRQLEKSFLYIDGIIGRVVPNTLNPLQHTGAIAVVSFLVATVSGIVLLVWYRPSVHLAFASVEAMSSAPYTAGLMRSLHRYGSDASVFFALVHAIRFFLERRFTGARWLAWVTGVLMMAILWFIGWTGYWLVWDLRAQLVAVSTAHVVDVLPIFVDPLIRSFLSDEGVNSLLFFVVFFLHMLIPLAMGVVMWLHITRLSRPGFLTTRPMTIWILGSLLILCLLYPATSAERASMTLIPRDLTIDWWFLLPLALTDRLSGGALWAALLIVGAVLFSIPWWLAGKKSPAPATVVATRCNECRKCYQDCPYGAIEMIARSDGNMKYPTQASVQPSKCVACGICAGSCDTAGVGVDWLPAIDQRRRIEAWLKEAETAGERIHIAFTCAQSAGAGLDVDPDTGCCAQLPAYRVLSVPCAGWVHPLLIERAFRHGAEGVLIAACGPGQCQYREGGEWARMRISGEREPALRTDKVDESRVRFLELSRTRTADLVALANASREEAEETSTPTPSPALSVAAAAMLAIVAAGIMGIVADSRYVEPRVDGSELVVSFKHPGAISENCRDLTPEEIEARPIHMRKQRECERMRSPVRLLLQIDGAVVVQKSFAPTGLWGDGSSVAVERIPLEAGEHLVGIAIGDGPDSKQWSHRDSQRIKFTLDAKRVILFDRLNGFSWY